MGKVFRAIDPPAFSPELKTYYSKLLLDKLVPAILHSNTIASSTIQYHATKPDEIEVAANKWREYFGVTLQPVWYETTKTI